MLKNKRIRIIIISTLVALVISALYMLGIISDEIKLYKLEATSVLDNQVSSIRNEFMVR